MKTSSERCASEATKTPGSFVQVTGFAAGAPVARLAVEEGGVYCDAGAPFIELPSDPLVRFAYSGREGALFQAGGGAGPTSPILRWDVEQGTFRSYSPAAHAPSPLVLGIAYDTDARLLYVLDVQEENGEQITRLVAHDLDTESSQHLWAVPYKGNFTWVALNLNEERRLILTAGHENGFVSWAFDSKAGAFVGQSEGNGALAALPAMGQHRLSLQTWDEELGLQTHVLGAWLYQEGDACTEL